MKFKSITFMLITLVFSASVNAATLQIDAFSSGYYNSVNGNPSTTQAITIRSSGPQTRNWFKFDLSGISGTIVSATLEVESDYQNASGQNITWRGVSSATTDLLGSFGTDIFSDLGNGSIYASGAHTAGVLGTPYKNTYAINSEGLTSLNNTSSSWAISGSHNDSINIVAFGFTSGVDSGDLIRLNVEVVPIPAAVWLFTSGIIGLLAAARRKV